MFLSITAAPNTPWRLNADQDTSTKRYHRRGEPLFVSPDPSPKSFCSTSTSGIRAPYSIMGHLDDTGTCKVGQYSIHSGLNRNLSAMRVGSELREYPLHDERGIGNC